MKLVSKFFF